MDKKKKSDGLIKYSFDYWLFMTDWVMHSFYIKLISSSITFIIMKIVNYDSVRELKEVHKHVISINVFLHLMQHSWPPAQHKILPCVPPHQRGQALGCVEPQPWTCNFVHPHWGFRGYRWYPPLLQMVPVAFCTQKLCNVTGQETNIVPSALYTGSSRVQDMWLKTFSDTGWEQSIHH